MQARKKTKRHEIVVPKPINSFPDNPKLEEHLHSTVTTFGKLFSNINRLFSFLSRKEIFESKKDVRQLEIEGRLKKMSDDVAKFKILKDE
ncbi:MAG: hypothetical protein J0G29_03285 [Alphaproteobacteria bacterium]|nr:hypothetical protein [Alphaproteobacteria bacterium]OJV46599.1 MAG: hypothetical protein BGO28_04485 [Alphaproteobacteria bacterium 43-37]